MDLDTLLLWGGWAILDACLRVFILSNISISSELDIHWIMTKAFSYLRVSGKGQVEGDGFTRQHTAIKAYAAANDIRIVKEFREEGVSGSVENMNRPAWSAMLTGASRRWRSPRSSLRSWTA